jgi:hypothetical protein
LLIYKKESIIEIEKKWAQKVVTNAKSILLRNKKVATGRLYNSVSYSVSPDGDISFSYAEEGKYVESGRRRGARYPPPGPILQWIKVKGIKGRDRTTGKFITDKSLTFLIQRAISRDGIKPVKFMSEAIEKATQQLLLDLDKSITAYYNKQFAQA